MNRRIKVKVSALGALIFFLFACTTVDDSIAVRQSVTLKEAHIGSLAMDTKLLDSYQLLPENFRGFYLDTRHVFANNSTADFTHPDILEAARKHDLLLMGGPMLGQLRADGVTLWLRPSTKETLTVKVIKSDGSNQKIYTKTNIIPGVEQRITLDDLSANTEYKYSIYVSSRQIAKGEFLTAPYAKNKGLFRLAFGSDFHKIGLHNPNIINQIIKRNPQAMLLLGDNAVDDRVNNINMHRADYALRDVSKPWRDLAANVPIYAIWDDHDYFDNDLSGIPENFTASDRDAVRAVWHQNWNNPKKEIKGIYFNTRIGPVEVIMLDTRSYRENERRGSYGSYLGNQQLTWLKHTLKNSTAPFKVIASGTMWSDDISAGKDSWGTWDIEARDELFSLIETEEIHGVLLISGDRHGARGFNITRPSGTSGYKFYEFEAATLAGVEGPEAMAKDPRNQLFGYTGKDTVAFGEFIFDTRKEEPIVTFRLIDQRGKIMEKHVLSYGQLTPSGANN
jgi:alkaline phosphatase D